VREGIGRIAAGFSQPGGRRCSDVTLAFAASGDCPWLCLPAASSCLLEAQTPLRCDLQPVARCPVTPDLISQLRHQGLLSSEAGDETLLLTPELVERG